MKEAIATLKGITAYSQGRHYDTPKKPKELHVDYEKRTWKERLHVGEDGKIFIPAMAFKVAISEAAKYLSEQIPGKGKTTYTKHFEAGISVPESLSLPYTPDDVHGEWVFVPSDGRRGGGKRVNKCFPRIDEWQGVVKFYILDDVITQDVFTRTLKAAGGLIGIGRFRPRNNGDYGRFIVEKLDWTEH